MAGLSHSTCADRYGPSYAREYACEAISVLCGEARPLLGLSVPRRQFCAASSAGFHCKGWPDRAGTCDTDRQLPVFRFDDAVLEGMRDAQH